MKKQKAFLRSNIRRIYASINLLLFLGVFLFPQFALASSISDEKIIELTNKVREKQGLNTLNANQLLTKAAYEKAETIFKEQIFKHNINNLSFSSWVKEAGYDYQTVGENLAIDFVTSEGAMKAWLNSASHKKNILNPEFKEIGIAVKSDEFEGKNSTLIVQIFGSPKNHNSSVVTLENNIDQNKEIKKDNDTLLTHSAKDTLIMAQSGTGTQGPNTYISEPAQIYGQELINFEIVEQAVIYIVDNTNTLLINYYYTAISLLLLFFSSVYIWQKKITN